MNENSRVSDYLSKINALLFKIKVPITLLSLKECVPSLWIAVFEGLLETRIPDIDRSFELSNDSRTRNIIAVQNQIQKLFKIDISYIKPEDLILYDESAICNMIDIFTNIAESIDDWNDVSSEKKDLNSKGNGEGQRKRKRSIYTGNNLLSVVKDDVTNFVKDSNRESLNNITIKTPIKEDAAELLKAQKTDTPHMKALKLKRMNLLKKISQVADKASKASGLQKTKESNLDQRIAKEIKQIYSRPDPGPLSEIEKVEIIKKGEFMTRPEKNLENFQARVCKSIPTLEPYPSKKAQDNIHEQQTKTWKKALDDRLRDRKLNAHTDLERISADNLIIEQAKRDIEKTRNIEEKRKEAAALRNIKAGLSERIRGAVRMEHRRQVVHEEVENMKLKRRFREEQAVKGLLNHYVKEERKMIIEERRFEKDKKKAQEQKIRQKHESKLNYYRDQIQLLKEQYEETKKEEEIMEKAMKEEHRKIVREKKEAAKNKVRNVKEKLEVDSSNLGFQEETAQRLKSGLKFAFR